MSKTCVIGWPIGHSRSPLIHNYWLKQYGIDSYYDKCAVEPSQLTSFINSMKKGDYLGCNVTIPHKETILTLVDVVDQPAKMLQAANTLYVRKGQLRATNTDGQGFIANLYEKQPHFALAGKNIILIGAGGAARAIAGALLGEGVASINIFNRTPSRTKDLQNLFGETINPLTSKAQLAHCDLLVNTTSLGMEGQPALEFDLSLLPTAAVVADIVYAPLITNFLRTAQERGHPIVTGLGMLLHQAVGGFELWYGVKPKITKALTDLITENLKSPKPHD